MSDFKQAIEWLKEGKKVKRSSISNKKWYLFASEKKGEEGFIYLHHSILQEPTINSFNLESFEATDWEIYEESKESLSDKFFTISNAPGFHKEQKIVTEDDIKEKIQNAQRRLKEEVCDKPYGDECGYCNRCQKTKQIFKEEFGDKLSQ